MKATRSNSRLLRSGNYYPMICQSKPKPKPTNTKRKISSSPLSEARKLMNLRHLPPSQIMYLFALNVDEDGYVSKQQFMKTMERIILDCNFNKSFSDKSYVSKVRTLITQIYKIIDRYNFGKVDYVEVMCSLMVFRSGSLNEKAMAIFDLFDYRNIGYIFKSDMIRYLTYVFNVMYNMENDIRIRAHQDILAITTANSIWKRYGLKKTWGLSIKEFLEWYNNI